MKKLITEGAKCALFGGLVFCLTLIVFNLYAAKTGAPVLW